MTPADDILADGADNETRANFDRTLMEIAYMGVFYGLLPQAHRVFDHFTETEHGEIAAGIGRAFALIAQRQFRDAIATLEPIVKNHGDDCPESKALLVLACRMGGVAAQRAGRLLQELARTDSAPLVSFAGHMTGHETGHAVGRAIGQAVGHGR